jgi:hypothetical protein
MSTEEGHNQGQGDDRLQPLYLPNQNSKMTDFVDTMASNFDMIYPSAKTSH